MKHSLHITLLAIVFLTSLAAMMIGASLLSPPAAPLKANDGPRSFHDLTEFHAWRDRYASHLEVNGDCDVLAEYLSRLAAEDGFLLGYTYVPYTGVIDGIRIFPINSWTPHVANLIMTDTELYYYDDNSKQIVYIGKR
jgi:hypothetical protein